MTADFPNRMEFSLRVLYESAQAANTKPYKAEWNVFSHSSDGQNPRLKFQQVFFFNYLFFIEG